VLLEKPKIRPTKLQMRGAAYLGFLVFGVAACSKPPENQPSTTPVGSSQGAETNGASCAIPSAQTAATWSSSVSVLDAPLATCSTSPMTGVYRNGKCSTGESDLGVHVVCAQVTDDFLAYTASKGNDLSTPRSGFAGLKSGDRWCLCAARWAEANAAGKAPPVVLEATERAALRFVSKEDLLRNKLQHTR
jgi:uncharacterized protein